MSGFWEFNKKRVTGYSVCSVKTGRDKTKRGQRMQDQKDERGCKIRKEILADCVSHAKNWGRQSMEGVEGARPERRRRRQRDH